MPESPQKPQKPGVDIGSGRKRIEIFDREEQQRSVPPSVLWAIAVVVVAILIGFFAVPAYKGYTVYSAMKESGVPETYMTDMVRFQQEKTAAELIAKTAAEKSAEAETKRAAAESNLVVCREEASEERDLSEQRIDEMSADLDLASKDLSSCMEQQGADKAVISDAARRLCCAQRVENPAINGYVVSGDKIACVQDGGTPVSC